MYDYFNVIEGRPWLELLTASMQQTNKQTNKQTKQTDTKQTQKTNNVIGFS